MQHKIIFLNSGLTDAQRNIMRGVLEYAKENGPWDISTFSPAVDTIKMLLKHDYDGCIGILGRDDLASLVRKSKIPAINISGGMRDFGLPKVGVSDVEIGVMAADYLIHQGFSQYAYYGLDGEDFSDSRRHGFLVRLQESNLEADIYCEKTNYPTSPRLRTVSTDLANYPPVRWLASLPTQTAILASDDVRGNLLCNYSALLGLSMPEDVGVLSVGNDELRCESAAVPMSSVEGPNIEVGYEAARCLDLLIQGKKPPAFPRFRPPTRVVERQSTDLLKIEHPNMAKALNYIAQHGRNKITVEDISRAAGMSLRSLERTFKKVLNRTIQQELIRKRIEWAKADLRSTNNSLEAIGADSGLNSGVYLSQIFKKSEGISPGEYRRQFRH